MYKKSASLVAVIFIACNLHAACAALTGTVTITGQVPIACNIVVTPAPGASNIADISAGATNKSVATVVENCNSPNGYSVSVAGTHSGDHTGLFVDSVSNDSQPFTISYDGNSVPSGGVVTDVTAPGINLSRPVTISYAANAALTSSVGFTYNETLTFTIASK